MDLLYSRYASPVQFMNAYINQGRFGEFVSEIFEMDFKRKQEEARKEEDNKLWIAYLLSASGQSFNEWRKGLKQEKEPVSYSMTDEETDAVKQQARGILSRFSPAKEQKGVGS